METRNGKRFPEVPRSFSRRLLHKSSCSLHILYTHTHTRGALEFGLERVACVCARWGFGMAGGGEIFSPETVFLSFFWPRSSKAVPLQEVGGGSGGKGGGGGRGVGGGVNKQRTCVD